MTAPTPVEPDPSWTAEDVLDYLARVDRWGSFTDGPSQNALRDCIEILAREITRLRA